MPLSGGDRPCVSVDCQGGGTTKTAANSVRSCKEDIKGLCVGKLEYLFYIFKLIKQRIIIIFITYAIYDSTNMHITRVNDILDIL